MRKLKKTIKTLKLTLIEFNKFTDLSKIKKQVNQSKWLTLNIIHLKSATNTNSLKHPFLQCTHKICNIFFQPKNSKPIFLLPLFI